MRPIDADALERDLFDADWILDNDEHMVEDILRKQPTIDAVPVVHGDFEKYPEEVILNLRVTPFLCKTCRTTFITLNKEGKRFMFCSYCGTKMDGGKDDENA